MNCVQMAANTFHQKLNTPSTSSSSYRQFVTSLVSELAQALAASNHPLNPFSSTDPNIKHILLTLHTLFPNELLPALDILDRRLIIKYTTSQDEAKDRFDNRHDDGRLGNADSKSVSSPNNNVDKTEATPLLQDRDQGKGSTSKSFVQDPAVLEATSSINTTTLGITNTVHETIHANRDVPLQSRQYATSNTKLAYSVYSGRQQTVLRSKGRDTTTETVRYEVRLLPWSCSCPAFAFSAFPANRHSQTVLSYPRSTNDSQVGGVSLGDNLPICKHILACLLVDKCSSLAQFAETIHLSDDELHGWAAGYGD